MHDRLKHFVLRLCKVPSEPAAPHGSAVSVQVFRASGNLYKLSLLKWAVAQTVAVLGAVFWLAFDVSEHIHSSARSFGSAFHMMEMAALGVLLLQMPFTYFLVRLDYEMRWYIVTDRSLRIRHGVQQVREMTLTFANIQQITVHQGPVQRFLGIADLQVQTAGGGGASSGEGGGHGHSGSGDSMHVGYFRGVDNAEEIRDLIVLRLRRYRDSGLGDPDEVPEEHPAPAAGEADVLLAARAVLSEARALRQALTPSA